MAISKKEVNETGQGTQYHRVVGAMIDMEQKQVHINVASYTDISYREAEKADEKLIADSISSLDTELAKTDARLKEIETEQAAGNDGLNKLQNELVEIAKGTPAADLSAEFTALTIELQQISAEDTDRIEQIKKRRDEISGMIPKVEAEKSEEFNKKAAEFDVVAERQAALTEESFKLQQHRAAVIEDKQIWESALVKPRFVTTQKYSLAGDVANKILDLVYPEVSKLEPFDGGKKV